MNIKKFHAENDWEKIKLLVNKIKGGASYCGTVRLQQACEHFDNYISSGETTFQEELYLQLLGEISALEDFVRERQFQG
jgi:two-component system aerobic respiration control sensor histidine kinase ArcB